MSENKKYTIVVKSKRVEVSESVYHAYHEERYAKLLGRSKKVTARWNTNNTILKLKGTE